MIRSRADVGAALLSASAGAGICSMCGSGTVSDCANETSGKVTHPSIAAKTIETVAFGDRIRIICLFAASFKRELTADSSQAQILLLAPHSF